MHWSAWLMRYSLVLPRKMKKMIFWCCTAIFLFCLYPTVRLTAKETSDSQKKAEAEAFIKELYEAQTNRDVNWIRERLEDDAAADMAIILSRLYFDDFGFQKYDNVEVKAYPTSREDCFLACVVFDMVIDWSGEELSLPGRYTWLVKQNRNSQWSVASESGLPDEFTEQLKEQMEQLISGELADWALSVEEEFYDIMFEAPELYNWLYEVTSQAEQWAASIIPTEKDAWDYLFNEEDGLLTASLKGEEDNIYIVQKGDCLWRIAERELGDSMYWFELYEANRDVIGENPNLLWVGMELDLTY